MKNRVIKFRVWNGEQMVSPDYIDRQGVAHWKENSIHTMSENLLQFTGLTDKNGKAIWEGDVVSIDNGDDSVTTVCKWDNGCFTLEDLATGTWTRQLFYQSARLTVIGNIFENPELLT